MSQQHIDRFEQKLHTDRKLAEQLWRVIDRERFLEHYVALARNHGFRFSRAKADAAGILKKYDRLFQRNSDGRDKTESIYRTQGGLSSDVDGLSPINKKTGRVDF